MLPNPPNSLYPAARLMHTIGKFLIEDDASDLGYMAYHGREGHYYHGRHSPDHPSPFHHWQIGSIFVLLSHIWGVAEMAKQAQMANEEAEQLYADDDEESF